MRVGREDNHAKSASPRVMRGLSTGSPRGEACVGRAARKSNTVATMYRSLKLQTWRGVGAEEP